MSVSTANKQVAKNTLFLYFRMAIIMIVKLYTSRVLLEVLGIDGYGVWNVVAAFIVSFSFISTPLVSATQRFLNFDMGSGGRSLNRIFSTSVVLFFAISLVVMLVLETFGVWFLNSKMSFSTVDMTTVNYVFQISIISFVINLLRMPYESALIADEKMGLYAMVSVLEAVMLLIIVGILKIGIFHDNLICYALLNLLVVVVIWLCYWCICKKKLTYTGFKYCFDRKLLKEMGTFSGWSLFGAVTSMTSNQGLNILINMFFGVVMNAAFAVSLQIKAAVNVIIENLFKASNPQIVKRYSSGEIDQLNSLLSWVLKISFLLCFVFIVPMIINVDLMLKIWLGNDVPPNSAIFVILMLVQLLVIALGNPLEVAILATGKVKDYQLWFGIVISLNIFICYVLFKIGWGVEWALVIKTLVEVLVLIVRISFVRNTLGLNVWNLLKSSIFPLLTNACVVGFILYAVNRVVPFGVGWHRFWFSCLLFFPVFAISSWFIAVDRFQRKMLISFIRSKIFK